MTRMLEPDVALGMSCSLLGCSLGGTRGPQKFGEGDGSDGWERVWSGVRVGGGGLRALLVLPVGFVSVSGGAELWLRMVLSWQSSCLYLPRVLALQA